jgi:hypothetical protein
LSNHGTNIETDGVTKFGNGIFSTLSMFVLVMLGLPRKKEKDIKE